MILQSIEQGDAQAAEKLLPLVYEELRRLAAFKMAGEADGQTLQPTALVHEAWLRLASITIPDSVITIEYKAFASCGLTNVTIPDSVTNIGDGAFQQCNSLTSLSIGNSFTSIGDYTVLGCGGLQRVYFSGNAPTVGSSVFNSTSATLYCLPGTTGWTDPFAGRPAVLWNPHILTGDRTFGVHAGHFGFTFVGTNNIPVAIEACTNLANPHWTTVTHLTCGADGTVQFTDPDAANQPKRYYRFRPE